MKIHVLIGLACLVAMATCSEDTSAEQTQKVQQDQQPEEDHQSICIRRRSSRLCVSCRIRRPHSLRRRRCPGRYRHRACRLRIRTFRISLSFRIRTGLRPIIRTRTRDLATC
uniref:ACYPI008694 protein n=1 Tax=Acyrthosiphon pisum TaxID=7029 RepID=C4WWB4_ACYPI|nr:ACYPI008694 [Acyrthosiphon pisum]